MDPLLLSKLDNDYQILTELHRSGNSRTYLARHLTLNRDVTISVIGATGDAAYLRAFAADVERLTDHRHPNIVPVIEGRWLDDRTYAVVRARVRGSTLDQLNSAVGAMPRARIDAAMREVASALAWARSAGVSHRAVSPDSLVFQQGSGKTLVSFEPTRQPVSDARTIRDIATLMNGGAPIDVSEYTAMLAPGTAAATLSDVPVAVPVGRDVPEPAVVVARKGMGFNARVLSAFAVVTALVVLAMVFFHQRSPSRPVMANGVITDTQGEAAGDVALRSARHDTAYPNPTVYPTPTIVEPPAPPPSTAPIMMPPTNPMPQPMPGQPMPGQSLPGRTMPGQPMPPPQPTPVQPSPVQPMPVQPAAPTTRPAPSSPTPADTTARAPSGDACDSPTDSDQRNCLMNAIERNDRDLNATYRRLIAAMRKQAGVEESDPDPSSVDDLRAAQRRWLQERDDACHGTGSGLLYARDRAACFAERSAMRQRELQRMLQEIPEGVSEG